MAKILARRLKYLYLDTGAMYRAVALWAKQKGIDIEDEGALEGLCQKLNIYFVERGEKQCVICQGQDVTEKIREPEIGWLASKVSMKRPVRQAMVRLQRKIGGRGKVVAEGRDTGTVVFPRAEYKFFLDADAEERARRRYQEMASKGLAAEIRQVEKEIKERDKQDSSRELAPLYRAPDAAYIDSTGLKPNEVVRKILATMAKDPKS